MFNFVKLFQNIFYLFQKKKKEKTRSRLTTREKTCLTLLRQGHDLHGIAQKLNLHFRTVEFFLKNGERKLADRDDLGKLR